jgi:hypothetical protein
VTPSRPVIGVQFHGLWDCYWEHGTDCVLREHLRLVRENGAGVIRVDVGWSTCQEEEDSPGFNYYTKRLDRLLGVAADQGLEVLLTLHQSPKWARPSVPDENYNRFPDDPTSIRPWAEWIARTFGDRVRAWEIWNEPNIKDFTGIDDPEVGARLYVPVLKNAAEGLRAGDPSATIVFGGPAGVDSVFIQLAYNEGAPEHFDILALHPYQGDPTVDPWTPDGGGLPAPMSVVVNIKPEKPIWWTEFGYSVHANECGVKGWQKGVPTEEAAGHYLVRAFDLATQQFPQVRLGVVYTAYRPRMKPKDDSESHYARHINGYSMIREKGVRERLRHLVEYGMRNPAVRPLT